MAAGNSGDWHRFEAALRRSLRLLRDSLRGREGLPGRDGRVEEAREPEQQPSALQALPLYVVLLTVPDSSSDEACLEHTKASILNKTLLVLKIEAKLYILSFLTSKDLCHLGCTNHYWQLTVQDPLLWRYLLIRDLPSWHSIDWRSLPKADIFNRPFSALHEGAAADYMAIYKKCSSWRKRPLKPSLTPYGAVTSILRSLAKQEPRFAMFGPGLEDLDESLVHNMMTSPEILPLAGIPQRQIHGIGSGVTFLFKNQKRFNILTLYSKTSKERRTAREESANPINKMFHEIRNMDGTMQYNPIEHVKNLCQLVDGFIYVADAEAHKSHSRQTEVAQMAAMLNPALGPPGRPVLILSCISSAEIKRLPCIYMAHQLQLHSLSQPWMVQDIEAATLDGLLDGIECLLGETGDNNAQ